MFFFSLFIVKIFYSPAISLFSHTFFAIMHNATIKHDELIVIVSERVKDSLSANKAQTFEYRVIISAATIEYLRSSSTLHPPSIPTYHLQTFTQKTYYIYMCVHIYLKWVVFRPGRVANPKMMIAKAGSPSALILMSYDNGSTRQKSKKSKNRCVLHSKKKKKLREGKCKLRNERKRRLLLNRYTNPNVIVSTNGWLSTWKSANYVDTWYRQEESCALRNEEPRWSKRDFGN